jgi:predicted TIM-barrel fold metal-dependent hydrolase
LLFERYPNLYGDLSAGSGHNAVSRDPEFGYAFLESFQDRLLFGTDISSVKVQAPLRDFLVQAVEGGHISREAFEKVSWRNANRLLKLGL